MGVARPLALQARPKAPADDDYSCIEEVAPDAPIRARLNAPHIFYVGSHEGCGCGFNSNDLDFEGIETVAEAQSLLAALDADELVKFRACQRSRERLRDLASAALADGPVQLYACWAGDEGSTVLGESAISPEWLAERTAPLAERHRYTLMRGSLV